jgi:hypothetical protein
MMGSYWRRRSRSHGLLRCFAGAGLGAVLCLAALPSAAIAASAPAIIGFAAGGGENMVTAEALIRPNGLETKYVFWLRSRGCGAMQVEPCETVEEIGSGSVPAGSLEASVKAAASSLKWNSPYAVRVTATNSLGGEETAWLEFTTPTEPTGGAPGGTGGGKAYELEEERWNLEAARRAAEEAPRLEAERAAKKHAEEERPAREAAERAAALVTAREAGERAARETAQRELRARASRARCRVPALKGETLAAARAALLRGHCRLGSVTGASSRRGLVVTGQSHPKGARLAHGAAVAVRLGHSGRSQA